MSKTGAHGEKGRAVLWDVDGTLVNSLELHWISWRDALESEGFDLKRAQFLETFGQRNDEILRRYFGEATSADAINRIGSAKEQHYRDLVKSMGIEPLPGVITWLNRLKQADWRQALASSAPVLNVDAIIGALGIADYFDAMATAEDVERGKPDPQIFFSAADKLGIGPERCVVVEDAPAGVEAARRAGMVCIGVLSTHSHLDSDVVVSSLADLDASAFDDLIHDVT